MILSLAISDWDNRRAPESRNVADGIRGLCGEFWVDESRQVLALRSPFFAERNEVDGERQREAEEVCRHVLEVYVSSRSWGYA